MDESSCLQGSSIDGLFSSVEIHVSGFCVELYQVFFVNIAVVR